MGLGIQRLDLRPISLGEIDVSLSGEAEWKPSDQGARACARGRSLDFLKHDITGHVGQHQSRVDAEPRADPLRSRVHGDRVIVNAHQSERHRLPCEPTRNASSNPPTPERGIDQRHAGVRSDAPVRACGNAHVTNQLTCVGKGADRMKPLAG